MKHQTAAILVIGNEVLSGRTREANAWLAAQRLFDLGCRLEEITVVPDRLDAIADALNRLRRRYEAVITSGGIGPTHDDLTMEAVAAAFGVPLVEDAAIVRIMQDRFGPEGLNESRRRMALMPQGTQLIRCDKTIAPGAHLDNVYVLAGVPEIFASQLEAILPEFGGAPYIRREIEVPLRESLFAQALEAIQKQFADVEIGSYPSHFTHPASGKICLSGRDATRLEAAESAVRAMLSALTQD
jgi:molybdenum cofactor synthesis domain-containing protein